MSHPFVIAINHKKAALFPLAGPYVTIVDPMIASTNAERLPSRLPTIPEAIADMQVHAPHKPARSAIAFHASFSPCIRE